MTEFGGVAWHSSDTLATVTATFEESGQRIDMIDFSEYFKLLQGAYSACHQMQRVDFPRTLDETYVHGRVQEYVLQLSSSRLASLFSKSVDPPLTVVGIHHESPFRIVVAGLASAVVLAVILSGGDINMRATGLLEIESKLPPIGSGIIRLRQALAPYKDGAFDYNLRPKTVTLSQPELDLLMNVSTEGSGGFQRFIGSLQHRVDGNRRLELLAHDITYILKYSRPPWTGTWQKTLHRIFKRHFGLDTP